MRVAPPRRDNNSCGINIDGEWRGGLGLHWLAPAAAGDAAGKLRTDAVTAADAALVASGDSASPRLLAATAPDAGDSAATARELPSSGAVAAPEGSRRTLMPGLAAPPMPPATEPLPRTEGEGTKMRRAEGKPAGEVAALTEAAGLPPSKLRPEALTSARCRPSTLLALPGTAAEAAPPGVRLAVKPL